MHVNSIKIISRNIEKSYTTFKVLVKNKNIEVKFTIHAIDRIKRWDIKENEVINALIFPDEVVIGHGKRFIAHKIKNSRIIRTIYEYRDKIPFVITVYAPSKERYFQGGNKYADKILP